jgi:hypothetical protein
MTNRKAELDKREQALKEYEQRLTQFAANIDSWINYKLALEGQVFAAGIELENLRFTKQTWKGYIK